MIRSRFIPAVSTLVIVGSLTGVGVATAANGAATTHTMQFVATQIKDVMVNDKDVATDKNTHNGTTVGFDVTSCSINITTHIAACTVAVARAQGLLFAKVKVNLDSGQGTGNVTGGTERFQGASGTATVNPGSNRNSNKITIKYQV